MPFKQLKIKNRLKTIFIKNPFKKQIFIPRQILIDEISNLTLKSIFKINKQFKW